jgi:L-cysteine desulfidase
MPINAERLQVPKCNAVLWEVVSIAGAHTRVVRVLREHPKGVLQLVRGGAFSSETAQITRTLAADRLSYLVKDIRIDGTHATKDSYVFNCQNFIRVRQK